MNRNCWIVSLAAIGSLFLLAYMGGLALAQEEEMLLEHKDVFGKLKRPPVPFPHELPSCPTRIRTRVARRATVRRRRATSPVFERPSMGAARFVTGRWPRRARRPARECAGSVTRSRIRPGRRDAIRPDGRSSKHGARRFRTWHTRSLLSMMSPMW